MVTQSIRADQLREGDILLGDNINAEVLSIMVCGPETTILIDTGEALDVISEGVVTIQPRQLSSQRG